MARSAHAPHVVVQIVQLCVEGPAPAAASQTTHVKSGGSRRGTVADHLHRLHVARCLPLATSLAALPLAVLAMQLAATAMATSSG